MSAVTILVVFCIFSKVAAEPNRKVNLIVSNPDLLVGATEKLYCRANKRAEFEWQKDGEEIEQGFENSGDMSTLILSNVKLTDSGKYTCISDFDGEVVKKSDYIYVYEKPNFGSTLTDHEFLVNDTVQVPCHVTGKPEVEINWYWNGAQVLNNVTSNLRVLPDNSLQIENIQRENDGTYVCEGKIKGRPKSETLNISVVVNVSPTVIFRPERTKVLGGVKRSVTLTCLVMGAPPPRITWTTPDASNSSRYIYNSDKSELTIPDVVRRDFGNYICTAENKIGNSSATLYLDVKELPSVFLSQNEMVLKQGDSASVWCNATGDTTPTVKWLNKRKISMASTGRLRAVGLQLQIENVVPSDAGLYYCEATNSEGNNTQEFSLITSPEVPTLFSVLPGPSAFYITLEKPLLDGGSPITDYSIQWRKESTDKWNNYEIHFDGALNVTSLDSYTEYIVRFAAKNKHFLGGFSAGKKIRTLDKRKPDMPRLSVNESKIEKNSYSIPLEQFDDGGSPITHYVVRYRSNKEGESWREKKANANSSIIQLQNLEYDSEYQAEVIGVNMNGLSKPALIYFSTPQAQHSLGKGAVVAIVLVIFLLLLVGVDALCCYTNQCGIINFVAQKLLGPNVSQSKSVEDGVFSNVAVTMNGLEKPRGSIPKSQSQNKMGNGMQADVTCDKAPLTKFEKEPPESDLSSEARV